MQKIIILSSVIDRTRKSVEMPEGAEQYSLTDTEMSVIISALSDKEGTLSK